MITTTCRILWIPASDVGMRPSSVREKKATPATSATESANAIGSRPGTSGTYAGQVEIK